MNRQHNVVFKGDLNGMMVCAPAFCFFISNQCDVHPAVIIRPVLRSYMLNDVNYRPYELIEVNQ